MQPNIHAAPISSTPLPQRKARALSDCRYFRQNTTQPAGSESCWVDAADGFAQNAEVNCKLRNEASSRETFNAGWEEGRFRFSSDRALLADLMETYQINIQRLAGEWLASTAGNSYYGDTPLLAACRLVVGLSFGKVVADA
jgi:hypothetical protein